MPQARHCPVGTGAAFGLLLLAVMEAAAARLGVQLIRQFPAKEQAELKVKVQIPGSWFGGSLEQGQGV